MTQMTTPDYHIPVMLSECLDGLRLKPDGVYVDVTYGGGGHARKILDQLSTGKLIAFDQDDDAVKNVQDHPNLIFVNHNFQFIKNFLKFYEIESVDGILADLGISSHQIDEGSRGFSFRFDAPLDMRMNQQQKQSAFDIINGYSAQSLSDIFKRYGELRFAWKLANKIVAVREKSPIKTTGELADLAREYTIPKQENRSLAQLFQAVRIEVNGELNVLEDLLDSCTDVLHSGGRLVVMSYHSLEDRMVKSYMQTGNIQGDLQKDIYGKSLSPYKLITRKPITATESELERNTRSRSAKLRVAEKI
jgi:16S rRNA (cytosine1402-N4)-methyltransferase